ncbi:sulfatase [Pontiellaceae bacterium B12227]|nr:sulfatase [Pontiellaceae bacterium B12227]
MMGYSLLKKTLPLMFVGILPVTGLAGGQAARIELLNEELTMERSPNIVFIVADQWRKQAAGFWSKEPYRSSLHDQGDPVHTPHIDRLANQGVVLTQAISTFPLCSPYRGMMLSGKLPHRNGVILNCNESRPASQLREDVTCISDVLSGAGYSMGYIGKLHTDYPTPNLPGGTYPLPAAGGKIWDAYTPPGPKRHCFDYWYSYGTFDEHFNPHYWDTEGKYHEPKEWSPDHDAGKAVSYIRNEEGQRKTDAPFGLWVSINPPHHPYDEVKDEDLAPYKGMSWEDLAVRLNVDKENEVMRAQIKNYFALVTGVDRAVGRIMKTLDEEGLAENTIVVVTSDHGEHMGSHGFTAKNHPYAESQDVPFLIRYPARLKPRTDDVLLGTCDIMPTLLGLAGLESQMPDDLDGTDLSDVLRGAPSETGRPTASFFFRNVNAPADAEGKVHDFVTDFIGARTERHYIWLSRATDQWEQVGLFDNVADPYQLNNLAATDPKLRGEMMQQLKAAIPARFPLENLHPEIAVYLDEID